jgi:peptidoglycan/LPS O-acetylase OafA/YrhL
VPAADSTPPSRSTNAREGSDAKPSGARWRRLLQRIEQELLRPPSTNLHPLDGLRAFAAAILVMFHCALFMGFYTEDIISTGRFPVVRAINNGLWSGVDMFFVLSGFLIGRILIGDLSRTGRIRYRRFLIRRSMRIFPAYYLVITLSLFVLAPTQPGLLNFLYMGASWDEIARGAWTNFVYLNNYLLDPTTPNIMNWGWSLCVEEHFYLIAPPLLWLVFRVRSSPIRMLLLCAGLLVPLVSRTIAYQRDPGLNVLDGLYYYSHNRFDGIMIGVIIAYLYVLHRDRLRRAVRRAGAWVPTLGILSTLLVWIAGGVQGQGPFVVAWQFLVVSLGSGLLLLNGLFLENRVTRFFAHPAWYPFARISYGTFLIHPFILFALLTLYRGQYGAVSLGNGGMVYLTVGTYLVTSVVAAAMFMLLERPLLDTGARLGERYSMDRSGGGF